MAWLPDINVWIHLLKQPGSKIEQSLLSHPSDQVFLCSIGMAQLWHDRAFVLFNL